MAKLDNLATFIEVVKRGGFASAARSLGLPRSTVSLRVKSLEDQLETRLLRRSTRAISLTDDGRALYDRIEEPFSILDQALDQISDGRDTLRGTIRLTVPADFPYAPLAEAMTSFRRIHPDVRFDVKLTNDVLDMIEENIDLAIRIGASSGQCVVIRKLVEFHVGFFAHPDWIAENGEPDSLSDVQALFLPLETTRELVADCMTEGTSFPQAAVEVNSFLMIRELALLGHGVGLLPCGLCDKDVSTGALRQVLAGTIRRPIALNMSFSTRGDITPRVRAFSDHLAKAFGLR